MWRMTTFQQKEEYNSFMKWFADTYPALFKKYGKEIIAPADNSGVSVNRRNLDTDTFNMLVQLERDYYSFIKK